MGNNITQVASVEGSSSVNVNLDDTDQSSSQELPIQGDISDQNPAIAAENEENENINVTRNNEAEGVVTTARSQNNDEGIRESSHSSTNEDDMVVEEVSESLQGDIHPTNPIQHRDLNRSLLNEAITSALDTSRSSNTPLPEVINNSQSLHFDEILGTNTNTNGNGLECPTGMDLEVFNSLPIEMQHEIVEQHQSSVNVAEQLDSASGLDPEALAALPEDMRREVIEQEQQERRLREQEQTPADPSHAEDMDNASFVASLAPDLREEILINSDDTFLNSLPPDIIAEAHLLRERASTRHRRNHEEAAAPAQPEQVQQVRENASATTEIGSSGTANTLGRKRNKTGKMRVDCDRPTVVYLPHHIEKEYGPLVTAHSMKALIRLMYLLSPVRPQRLFQKLLQNFCCNADLRRAFLVTFVSMLNDEPRSALVGMKLLERMGDEDTPNQKVATLELDNEFPPSSLIGTPPDIVSTDPMNSTFGFFRRRHTIGASAAIAANLPISAKESLTGDSLPPVVARRLIGTICFLSKNSGKIALDVLSNFGDMDHAMEAHNIPQGNHFKCLDKFFGLLEKPLYAQSSSNLEDLLNMIESLCFPLSIILADVDSGLELSKKEIDSAAALGKESIDIPRSIVSQQRLHLLCSTLRMESCKDASFAKVSNIAKRLCKVEANRNCILRELASVAQSLGIDAICDLKSLSISLNDAAKVHKQQTNVPHEGTGDIVSNADESPRPSRINLNGTSSSAVTLSTSSSELKLLRVLQTLHNLCGESQNKKSDGLTSMNKELDSLFQDINLESLWEQLTSCLRVVSVLEGVAEIDKDEEEKSDVLLNVDNEREVGEESTNGSKKLQNSVAGLLTRFLPTIEAFFVVNACSIDVKQKTPSVDQQMSGSLTVKTPEFPDRVEAHASGRCLVDFVATNKVLLNALLRSNPGLLDKGLRAMVQNPRCRPFLDFDVKRQWFKTQVRRLRQHANRRHGSLRLNIRREHVFEDAYHQLRLRNVDEIRGRLHITFRNEEGVDAGGLSREFFGILAKEMFNPNYALFTSTEDGCTFQPNSNSSINPDHLFYFRFVGRIVGKAVVDGFLLDAHFTRSLYKHMLGVNVRK